MISSKQDLNYEEPVRSGADPDLLAFLAKASEESVRQFTGTTAPMYVKAGEYRLSHPLASK